MTNAELIKRLNTNRRNVDSAVGEVDRARIEGFNAALDFVIEIAAQDGIRIRELVALALAPHPAVEISFGQFETLLDGGTEIDIGGAK